MHIASFFVLVACLLATGRTQTTGDVSFADLIAPINDNLENVADGLPELITEVRALADGLAAGATKDALNTVISQSEAMIAQLKQLAVGVKAQLSKPGAIKDTTKLPPVLASVTVDVARIVQSVINIISSPTAADLDVEALKQLGANVAELTTALSTVNTKFSDTNAKLTDAVNALYKALPALGDKLKIVQKLLGDDVLEMLGDDGIPVVEALLPTITVLESVSGLLYGISDKTISDVSGALDKVLEALSLKNLEKVVTVVEGAIDVGETPDLVNITTPVINSGIQNLIAKINLSLKSTVVDIDNTFVSLNLGSLTTGPISPILNNVIGGNGVTNIIDTLGKILNGVTGGLLDLPPILGIVTGLLEGLSNIGGSLVNSLLGGILGGSSSSRGGLFG